MDLKEFIEISGTPLAEMSQELEISKAMLSQVANGNRIPSLSLIKRLYEYSEKQITLDDYSPYSDRLRLMIYVVENCRAGEEDDSLRH